MAFESLIQKGAEAVAVSVIKAALERASKAFREKSPYATLDFAPHLKFAYERCTKIKTLLNRDTPVDLLQTYVTLNHSCDNKIIDDYELIDRIWKQKRVMITSTGGGGKSMFMRYFWIACTVDGRGKIPLYIELRRLNEASKMSFLDFIYHMTLSSTHPNAKKLFTDALSEGQFVLILDGFDEIDYDIRNRISSELLEISNHNPETLMVVSSRPDDRHDSWQNFTRYRVEPLNRKQTTELIKKVPFKEETKKQFLKKLRNGSFDKHGSFLQRPLLATMMLLMFEYYADVPEKVHLFYENAFNSLFYIHDSLKESFNRKRYTGYPIDVFKRYLGFVCLFSYNEHDLDFSHDELSEYVRMAGKACGDEIDVDGFINDLKESVCIIQDDGLSLTFTHRSFQEYFCAYCLDKLKPDHSGQLIFRFANRFQDTVVQILFDMNRDLVEQKFLLPIASECEEVFAGLPAELSILDLLRASETKVVMAIETSSPTNDVAMWTYRFVTTHKFLNVISSAAKMMNRTPAKAQGPGHRSAFDALQSLMKDKSGRITVVVSATSSKYSQDFDVLEDDGGLDGQMIEVDAHGHARLLHFLENFGPVRQILDSIKVVRKNAKSLERHNAQREKSLEELLDISKD